MSAKNLAPPKIFCSQKSAKNPMQKLPKNLPKICGKNSKNPATKKQLQKTFNKILAKNF